MQPGQALIEPLMIVPSDTNQLHATLRAVLTPLLACKDGSSNAAKYDGKQTGHKPPEFEIDATTYAAVVGALQCYISRHAVAQSPLAEQSMNLLSAANRQTRKKSLEWALMAVDQFGIHTATALELILSSAHSPFGKSHAVKVWRGDSALSLKRRYLVPHHVYYRGDVHAPVPIDNTEREQYILLLTGESGSGKTCLAHQLAEEFLRFEDERVGVAVYLRWLGAALVVPEKLLSRPSTHGNKDVPDDHADDVAEHLAKVVAGRLTAPDKKELPQDKSVQRVAIVLDECNSIMTYIRGLIAKPSAFTKALHAELGGAAADLDGGDETGFRVAIIVAGTGCGVASCDDATSQQISSHPKHFREVQLPVNDSNVRLRDAIFEHSGLPDYVTSFLLRRPETAPLTTNPRTLWEVVKFAESYARSFSEKTAFFKLTGKQAFAHAEMISCQAAMKYLRSNGLADKPQWVKDFYLTLASAFALFKNKLFNVPDLALKVLARYGFLVDNKFANKPLPEDVPRYTMSSAIRRTISVYFCYSLDCLPSRNGADLECTAADFF